MRQAFYTAALLFLMIFCSTVVFNFGFSRGQIVANEKMVDQCFNGGWTFLDVGNKTFSFHCDTSMGHSEMSHN